MCECRADIEARMKTRFIEQTPKGRDHSVSLKGYAFVIVDSGVKMIPCMPYETYALMPLAKGGEKPKKTTGNMMFNFCPFCGVKVDKDPAPQQGTSK